MQDACSGVAQGRHGDSVGTAAPPQVIAHTAASTAPNGSKDPTETLLAGNRVRPES